MVAVGALTRLLKQYEELKECVTPTEFVDIKHAERWLSSNVVKDFLLLSRHYQFVEQVVKDFIDVYKVRRYKKAFLMVLVYTVIFHVDESNYEHWFSVLTKWKNDNVLMLLRYFTKDENLSAMAVAGCRVFTDEYVIKEIIRPLSNKITIIRQLYDDLLASSSKKCSRLPVVSKGPSLLYRLKYSPPVPVNTPAETQIFKGREIPYRAYCENEVIQRNLQQKFMENRQHADELLQRARREAFSCSKIKQPDQIEEDKLPSPSPIKFKKPPPKKDVDIKTNAATVMREAALLAKKEEQEIQKLEILMQGGRDDYKISALEVEVRSAFEEERLKDIERKHLIGQLTYEEAILARKKLMKENKERAAQLKEERSKLLDEIEKWRLEEQKKIKSFIEMCQNTDRNAKEAHERLLEKRQRSAKLLRDENRKLLTEALQKRQEELKQKVKLIQELKALQQIRNLQVQNKEFDPTETQNLGLLCEMSIAELQERLGLLKLEMQHLLQEKRKKVADTKERKIKILEEAKDFIFTIKSQPKVEFSSAIPAKTNMETPEILELREKLQRAREMRLANV